MRRFVMTGVVFSMMALLLTSVTQSQPNGEGFIGLWQGVGDGGLLLTADISDIEGDGQFRIRINIQGFFAPCNALNEQGVPIELGHLVATSLTEGATNEEGDLIFTESLKCSATGREIVPSLETTLSLINDHTMIDLTPGIIFRRISASSQDGG